MADEPSNSMFQESWWLDAVCPGMWDEVTTVKQGQIVARLPYHIKRRAGLTILTTPPLTPALGPWLRPSEKKTNAAVIGEQKKLLDGLIDQLPPFDGFTQNFHPSITNWLPLYWRGFEQTTYYTLVIDDLTDHDAIWANMTSHTRGRIRKAEKEGIKVETTDDLEHFLDLNDLTFVRQGLEAPYSRDLVRRIDKACTERDCRRILVARDGNGQSHTGLYLVWNDESAYLLTSGGDPALRASGAGSLMTWEAIKFASTVTRVFDFEGSMVEPIERFYRGFGGRQVPYFHVRKTNKRFKAAEAGRRAFTDAQAVWQSLPQVVARNGSDSAPN